MNNFYTEKLITNISKSLETNVSANVTLSKKIIHLITSRIMLSFKHYIMVGR